MSSEAERRATAPSGAAAMRDDPNRYRIVPLGGAHNAWMIERDGKVWRTDERVEVLGAWLDAFLAGASEYGQDLIGESTVGLRMDSVELSAHSFRAHSRAYLRDTDNGYRHSQMVQCHKRIRLHSA
jgi:hypothetical protein